MTPATVSGHLNGEAETLAFKNPDGTIVLVVTNRTEADLVFEFKIEASENTQEDNLHNWEKVRTAANSKEHTENSDSKKTEKTLCLKCPPRAIQTWVLKDN